METVVAPFALLEKTFWTPEPGMRNVVHREHYPDLLYEDPKPPHYKNACIFVPYFVQIPLGRIENSVQGTMNLP